jgi:hypothetical protein
MGSLARFLIELDSRCRETNPLESQAEHEEAASTRPT